MVAVNDLTAHIGPEEENTSLSKVPVVPETTQPRKTHVSRQNTSKLRKHLDQFYMCAANTNNTIKCRHMLQVAQTTTEGFPGNTKK